MGKFVSVGIPGIHLFKLPKFHSPTPISPFEQQWLSDLFYKSMTFAFPLTIATVYFTLVHYMNRVVRKRQIRKAGVEKELKKLNEKELKRLPAASYQVANTVPFKILVMLHNLLLCFYSVWTFFGMLSNMQRTIQEIRNTMPLSGAFETFFESVCDLQYGIFSSNGTFYRLQIYGWWFYMSKFYEVIDTLVILLKGRPSSLLQSYHHAGAMMCMWAGIRFQSPPIWVFVVFNSFIHSLMYMYFFISSLKIKVPNLFKKVLTSMQITQFVVGGSLAVFHAFVWYTDISTNALVNCISTSEQALPLYVNVIYLAPLTGLFAAFYIESYLKKRPANKQ